MTSIDTSIKIDILYEINNNTAEKIITILREIIYNISLETENLIKDCYKAVLYREFSQEDTQLIFILLHIKKIPFDTELFISVAKLRFYTLLKWMEIVEPENCPEEIVDVIIYDINVLKYFLNIGYCPSDWAIANHAESNKDLDERLDLLFQYKETFETYESFQWLFIDNFREENLPILKKMVEICPEWLSTEHGWIYKYTLLRKENGNTINTTYLNCKLMISFETYTEYEEDEEEDVNQDSDYIELDSLLEEVEPNEETIRICGKNTSLTYHVIKKVFEKANFNSARMKEALNDFKKYIKDNNSSNSVIEKCIQLATMYQNRTKLVRKLEYNDYDADYCKKSKN